jgi:hypothetical protein
VLLLYLTFHPLQPQALFAAVRRSHGSECDRPLDRRLHHLINRGGEVRSVANGQWPVLGWCSMLETCNCTFPSIQAKAHFEAALAATPTLHVRPVRWQHEKPHVELVGWRWSICIPYGRRTMREYHCASVPPSLEG